MKRGQRRQANRKKMRWLMYEFRIKTVCFVTTIRISKKKKRKEKKREKKVG